MAVATPQPRFSPPRRVATRPIDKVAQIGADMRFYGDVLRHVPNTLRHYPVRSCGCCPRSASARVPSRSSAAPSA